MATGRQNNLNTSTMEDPQMETSSDDSGYEPDLDKVDVADGNQAVIVVGDCTEVNIDERLNRTATLIAIILLVLLAMVGIMTRFINAKTMEVLTPALKMLASAPIQNKASFLRNSSTQTSG